MKSKKFILSLVLCSVLAVTQLANAQQFNVTVREDQRENASAIIRLSETRIKILDLGNAEVYEHYILTVLKPGGDRFASFVEYYDKLTSIQKIEGTLYGGLGNKIRSLKKADIIDNSATDEISLVDDGRLKRHSFNYNVYPYTVEYEHTKQMNGIFYLPTWRPIFAHNLSVEKSNLEIDCPLDYKLRHKELNFTQEPTMVTTAKSKTYRWQLENLDIVKMEPFSPALNQIVPMVLLGPTDFQIQKYEGNMATWKEFGLFQKKLNEGRDELPETVKQKVHLLIDALNTDHQKIDVLYKFMQQNTRYISIQLGIGGWQSFDAKYVAKNGYGDCKALTNYMHSLLKEAGIKSYYSLVRAGENSAEVLEDFSSQQFNHVILCIPQGKDSMWLECTSQSAKTGYLGSFTADRNALLITADGGHLVHTPIFSADNNLRNRNTTGTINEEGQLVATIATTYRAERQDDIHGALTYAGTKNFKDYMQKIFGATMATVDSFSHTIVANAQYPLVKENVFINAVNYATVTGKRLFVTPNISSKSSVKIRQQTDRKFDFVFDKSFTDIDTATITLPIGYAPESIPNNTVASCSIGTFETNYSITDNKITVIRKYRQQKSVMPASKGKELTDFFDTIYKVDRNKIVFVRKD